MGTVRVVIDGSFDRRVDETFSATEGGHALALIRAIKALTDEMPAAIQKDHKLHANNDTPPGSPFGQWREA